MTNATESSDTLKERGRCMKLIDALTKDAGRRKRKMQQSPTAYAQGKECAYEEMERELETLRSQIESASIAGDERLAPRHKTL